MAEVMISSKTESDFSVFHDSKKQRYVQTREEKKAYPHLVGGERAYRLQEKLDVDNLAITLLSSQSKALQKDGWKYERVLRKGRRLRDLEKPNREYCTIDVINNRWKDQLLFSRPRSEQDEVSE